MADVYMGHQVKSTEKLSMYKFNIGVVIVVVILPCMKGLPSHTSAEWLVELNDGL